MDHLEEKSANAGAMSGWAKGLGWFVIIGVVLYSEFAFLSIVSVMFQPGLWQWVASIGALATGISIISLIIMKVNDDIHPGHQELVAWAAMFAELAIMSLNLMLSFAHSSQYGLKVEGFLAMWQGITPASPILAVVIWFLIFFSNPAHQLKHRQTELNDKIKKEEMQVDFETRKAQISVSKRYTKRIAERLDAAVDSASTQYLIQHAADKHTAKILSGLIGAEISPEQLRSAGAPTLMSKVVESNIETKTIDAPKKAAKIETSPEHDQADEPITEPPAAEEDETPTDPVPVVSRPRVMTARETTEEYERLNGFDPTGDDTDIAVETPPVQPAKKKRLGADLVGFLGETLMRYSMR